MRLPKRKPRSQRRARRLAQKAETTVAQLPGPSNNPATNLLVGDIAVRGLVLLIGRAAEKAILSTRYGSGKAADIVKGRTFTQSMIANGVARVGTRSVPGFLVVSGGLLAKSLYDRTFSRRESVARGEQALAEQADNAPES